MYPMLVHFAGLYKIVSYETLRFIEVRSTEGIQTLRPVLRVNTNGWSEFLPDIDFG